MKSSAKKIDNIQVLRFFAAIAVVFFHSSKYLEQLISESASLIVSFFDPIGAIGVDIFFVISGFVITYSQDNRMRRYVPFLKERFLRISPIYYVYTCIVIFLSIFLGTDSILTDGSFNMGLFFCSVTYTCQIIGYQNPIILVGWTLEYEMAFYVLAGVMSVKSKMFGYGIVTVWFIFLVFLGLDWIIFEFLFGVSAYYLWIWLRGNAYTSAMAVCFVLLATFVLVTVDAHRVLNWGIFGFLLVLASALLPNMGNNYWNFLGAASYSIYLVQVITLPAFFKVIGVIGLIHSELITFLLAAFITLIAGVASYQYVEKPLGLLKSKL